MMGFVPVLDCVKHGECKCEIRCFVSGWVRFDRAAAAGWSDVELIAAAEGNLHC